MCDVKSCEIIKDLFPLYKDGNLSKETEEVVRRHIASCENCNTLYDSMPTSASGMNSKLDENIRYQKIARRIRRKRLGIFFGVVGLFLFVWILSCNMFQRAVVSGTCMEPTILSHEAYTLNRWSYTLSSPERNHIIIYELDGISYITRIIGLPGETVEMKSGTIYINGNQLADQRNYNEQNNIPQIQLKGREYLTIVDNPNETSSGSKCIQKNQIEGKVWITH